MNKNIPSRRPQTGSEGGRREYSYQTCYGLHRNGKTLLCFEERRRYGDAVGERASHVKGKGKGKC